MLKRLRLRWKYFKLFYVTALYNLYTGDNDTLNNLLTMISRNGLIEF